MTDLEKASSRAAALNRASGLDVLAAQMTGMQMAKHHSTNELFAAHMRHPESAALEQAFLTSFVDDLLAKAFSK